MRNESDSVTFMADYARADYDPTTLARNARTHIDWQQAAREAEARRAARDKDKGGGRGGPQGRPRDNADWGRNPRHRAR